MKIDIQTVTDFSDYTRYTFYETWFNDKIVIVMEKKMMDEDWQVMTSVSLPKPLMEILKLKASGSRVSTSFGNVPTSINNYPGPRFSTILENVATSTNSYRAKTVVDRLELPTQVRKVLFKCDCEEIPLSENQMRYFSDLEALEWFWDIVKEDEFRRTKKLTLPSPFETIVNENSTEEGELLVYQEPKTAGNISNADVFTCQRPTTPETMGSNNKECPPAPKKPKKTTGVLFEFGERLDFSPL